MLRPDVVFFSLNLKKISVLRLCQYDKVGKLTLFLWFMEGPGSWQMEFYCFYQKNHELGRAFRLVVYGTVMGLIDVWCRHQILQLFYSPRGCQKAHNEVTTKLYIYKKWWFVALSI